MRVTRRMASRLVIMLQFWNPYLVFSTSPCEIIVLLVLLSGSLVCGEHCDVNRSLPTDLESIEIELQSLVHE